MKSKLILNERLVGNAKAATAVAEYEARVNEVEARWGVNRLPHIVDEELRERFFKQIDRLEAAAEGDSALDVEHQVEVTLRGFEALEKAARASGANELTGVAWSSRSSDGSKTVAIVNDVAEISGVRRTMPGAEVYSVNEVANILAAWSGKNDGIAQIKKAFPGAYVENMNGGYPFDDDIPF